MGKEESDEVAREKVSKKKTIRTALALSGGTTSMSKWTATFHAPCGCVQSA